jgi:hypothetical protein
MAVAATAASALLLLAAIVGISQARICLSNMKINNASPVLIHCGGTVNLDCSVDYEIDNETMSAGPCINVDAPADLTAQIWDDDGLFGHEWYKSWMVTIPDDPPSGTVNFTIPLDCTSAPECEDCKILGDENEAEVFLAFWNELSCPGSAVTIARCICGNCAHRTSLGDGGGVRGTVATFDWNTDAPFQGVLGFSGAIRFDPNAYQYSSLVFTDPFVQAHVQVTPTATGVVFQAHFPAPYDLLVGSFGHLALGILPNAPLAETWIAFDPQTVFLDQAGQPIPCCKVDGVGRTLPVDQTAPQIVAPLVTFDACTLMGRPGSIVDEYLGLVPNYVTVDAYMGNEYLGFRDVDPDGSFSFPNLALPAGSVIQFFAHDRNGNTGQTQFGPAGACTATVDEPSLEAGGIRLAPNPLRDRAIITFHIPEAGSGTLEVMDAAGRSVRRMELPALRAGTQELPWDGRDDRGELLPSGVYYYRVRAADRLFRGSLAVIH